MNSVIYKKAYGFRNIANYKFAHKLSAEHKAEIVEKVVIALGKDFKHIKISEADETTIKNLYANGLIKSNSTEVLLNLKNNVCIDLFNNEHITIVATSNFNKDVFKQVKEIADNLANKVPMAYSDEYGYLFSNIYNIGSGYMLEAAICLDSILALNKIEQVKQNINNLGYSLVETNIKSIYKLSTKCNLGVGETELNEGFNKTLEKLQELEIESAKMLEVSNHDEIYDKVVRSFAILNSAYLINNDELLNLLIILRTGANLGFIDLSAEKLNKLQTLVLNGTSSIISQTECKELANNVKKILKGE